MERAALSAQSVQFYVPANGNPILNGTYWCMCAFPHVYVCVCVVMCVPKTSAKSINFKEQSLNRRRAQALASHKSQRRRQLGKMKSKLVDRNIN